MKLVDSRQMKELDQRSIVQAGIPSLLLMENAARGALEACRDRLIEGAVCYVFCGTGNNGGDGYSLARLLVNHGFEVVVVRLAPPKTKDAQKNSELFRQFGQILEFEELIETLLRPGSKDVIFDAIIGTGLSQELDSRVSAAVDWINHAQGFKVSLDIPTGINASTGDEMGVAVQADRTLSFQLEKVGHHLHPGKARRGELRCIKVSILEEPLDTPYHLFDRAQAQVILPKLESATYKNQQGHVGVIAGSPGMMGAALLAGRSALRAGAGLASLHVPESEWRTVYQSAVELMSHNRDKTTSETLARYQSLVVGCGLGRSKDDWVKYFEWITHFVGPVVLDADAFYEVGPLQGLGAHRLVLTPHLGEFSQISGQPIPKTNEERILQARDFAVREGTTLVLKGAPSIVANADGEVWINQTGNPGMATAGSGDVLSGIIGGFLAQGMLPFEAARLGCWVHGRAGDLYARDASARSLCASDLICQIPFAFQELEL